MAGPLRRARRELAPGARAIAASPGETVDAWLIRNGQTARLREMLWEPLALAALNQPPGQAAAPVFARVLAEMFGPDPRLAAILLPAKPLHLMYAEPARDFIEQRGGAVRTGATARLDRRAAGCRGRGVAASGGSPDAVIAAVPWFALARSDRRRAGGARARRCDRASRMASSPIVTVNLWFDRAVLDEPFVGLPGRAMQWVFDKRAVFGGEASHLSLVSSGASPLVALTNPGADRDWRTGSCARRCRRSRRRGSCARPSCASRARRFRWRRASRRARRSQRRFRGLYLAGDWIDTGLPATIESAVRAGPSGRRRVRPLRLIPGH